MRNGVLNYIKLTDDLPTLKADVTARIAKIDLIAVLAGKEKMDDLFNNSKAKIAGDHDILKQITAPLDTNIKNDMNLVLPLQKANQIQQ
ncbi:alkyl sulfatase C-terminal domain-containing protein [Kluyvera georgiana]|uniref:alkyl sulfatase C-terminal domain-containing protein n=1 Tax=Kluyvera georgiana TaxID=73098 RepID=UPI000942E8A1|nr:alkyl sulfatase C-terminal domain-containing protein [Kluyvera georgiana]